jgi:hypothetical protein
VASCATATEAVDPRGGEQDVSFSNGLVAFTAAFFCGGLFDNNEAQAFDQMSAPPTSSPLRLVELVGASFPNVLVDFTAAAPVSRGRRAREGADATPADDFSNKPSCRLVSVPFPDVLAVLPPLHLSCHR